MRFDVFHGKSSHDRSRRRRRRRDRDLAARVSVGGAPPQKS